MHSEISEKLNRRSLELPSFSLQVSGTGHLRPASATTAMAMCNHLEGLIQAGKPGELQMVQ